jgi:hypothetical protein
VRGSHLGDPQKAAMIGNRHEMVRLFARSSAVARDHSAGVCGGVSSSS